MHALIRTLQGLAVVLGLSWGMSFDRADHRADVMSIVEEGANGLSAERGVQYRYGEPFTGVLVQSRDGVTRWTPFREGRADGVEIGRYADGSLAFQRAWSGGLRQGTALFWWPDGTLKERTAYQDDVPEGLSERWFSDGTPAQRFHYRAGQEDGAQMMWYEDGTIRAAYEVRNGRRYGTNGTKGCTTTEN